MFLPKGRVPVGLVGGNEAAGRALEARPEGPQNSAKESEHCPLGSGDRMRAAELGRGDASERLTWQLYKMNLVESSAWVSDSLFSNLLA